MNLALPTGRRGRLLALGLTFLVLALVWLVLVSPLARLYADRAEALDQQRIIAHRMALVAGELPDLQRQATAAAGSGPAQNALLEGGSDAIAGAALQERVQDMAASAGARLSSAEMLPAAQAGAYRRIGLRVACSAPWPVLVRLLQAVEQATPRMLVDDLKVHGPRIQLQAAEPPLAAELTIFAFRAGGSGGSGG
jgi:general secretion pathway protein M